MCIILKLLGSLSVYGNKEILNQKHWEELYYKGSKLHSLSTAVSTFLPTYTNCEHPTQVTRCTSLIRLARTTSSPLCLLLTTTYQCTNANAPNAPKCTSEIPPHLFLWTAPRPLVKALAHSPCSLCSHLFPTCLGDPALRAVTSTWHVSPSYPPIQCYCHSKTREYNKLCFIEPLQCPLLWLHLTDHYLKEYRTKE